jgi:hypothetical protein
MQSALFLVVAANIAGQTLAAPHLATREEVLAHAKHDSSDFCARPLRCTYSISGVEEGWSVLAVQVSIGSDGKESYPVGGHRAYVYSAEGKLLREVPGL